jgi:hypothetical protein
MTADTPKLHDGIDIDLSPPVNHIIPDDNYMDFKFQKFPKFHYVLHVPNFMPRFGAPCLIDDATVGEKLEKLYKLKRTRSKKYLEFITY